MNAAKKDNSINVNLNNQCHENTKQDFSRARGFKIAHLNVRSLIKHIDELRLHFEKQQFDVISLNETMLDITISNQEIKIKGYNIVRKDRNRHGGGVAMYIRSTINYSVRDDLSDENIETITVEITKPKSKSFLINSWYRPPNSSQDCFDVYEKLITQMDSEDKEVILVGDFNCDWSLLANNEANAQTKILAETTNALQFEQLINEPTRVTATTKSIIDLAFTNKPEIIIGSGVIHLGISDHSLIYIQRKISVPRAEPKIVKTRQFKYYNVDNLKSDIAAHLNNETIWSNTSDPNVSWELWKTRFLNVADLHALLLQKKLEVNVPRGSLIILNKLCVYEII